MIEHPPSWSMRQGFPFDTQVSLLHDMVIFGHHSGHIYTYPKAITFQTLIRSFFHINPFLPIGSDVHGKDSRRTSGCLCLNTYHYSL